MKTFGEYINEAWKKPKPYMEPKYRLFVDGIKKWEGKNPDTAGKKLKAAMKQNGDIKLRKIDNEGDNDVTSLWIKGIID